jgi:4'-phosphopantetheinyl transferase
MITAWQPFPEQLVCEPQIVYLVGISLTTTPYSEEHWQMLSTAEQVRAQQFKFEQHRQRFIVFHSCLRQVLARCLSQSPPAIDFQYGPHGKPSLHPTSNLQFNLSHTDTEAIIAITLNADIGVDIEIVKNNNIDALAQRFFADAENSYLQQTADIHEKHLRFYQTWALKEAFIKATGLGVSQNLKSFAVECEPARLLFSDKFAEMPWTLQTFTWKDNFLSAFATNQIVTQICTYQF